jgi:Asp-tRNA(Asn)/Glu-tRNA(Gln) amidotransferase A subunit family amidase
VQEISVGVVAPAYVNIPLWVAQERGFLDRRGLRAVERIIGTTDGVTTALRQGEVDIALTAPEGSIADAVAGGSLRVVAGLIDRMWLGMWWEDHDLLLTPTLGAPPPELGWFTAAGPQQEGERIISFIPYTAQFNMTGQPAISLPLHSTPEGLPVGVQMVAAYGREDLLIRVASQLEEAAPWSGRHAPVHA